MVIKALKEPPRDRKKVKNVPHDGDITFEDVYAIAKTMRERSMSRKMCVSSYHPPPPLLLLVTLLFLFVSPSCT